MSMMNKNCHFNGSVKKKRERERGRDENIYPAVIAVEK